MAKNLRQIDLYSIYKKWYRGSGPFRCFFHATNFVSLKHYPDFELHEVSTEVDDTYCRVENLINKYKEGKPLFLIDLPGVQAIRVAFLLRKNLSIHPILTFNNPLHPNGLIGGKEYISALLGYGELLQENEGREFVFILDQERYGDYQEEDFRRNFNNQYELIDEDLPSLDMLKDLGYNKLVYIYSGNLKEDTQAYLTYLEEQGFPIAMEAI